MKADVLIVGGGLSGVCAAYEIIQNSTLTVSLLQWGNGASPHIHGFCLPIGEKDSEELFFEDSMTSGYGQCRESLVRRLCRDSLELPKYFRELGVELDQENGKPRLIKALGSTVARIAGIGNNTGPVMLAALRKRLLTSDRYREYHNFRALKLLKTDGRVTGARCYDKGTDSFRDFTAGLVILASGGFGRLFPESTNSRDIGGDGCAMAYLAGGRMTDMEFIQFEPSAAVWPTELVGRSIITTMFYEGAVLRGGDGKRFMRSPQWECVSKDEQAKAISREICRGNATPHGGVWFDATAVPKELWNGVYKPYRDRYLPYGIDLMRQAVEIAPAAHTTCGGVLIDENCRTGVAGLLACGEVTGGLHGANRLGGNAGLETMVFGRTAGQTALRDWKAIEQSDEHACGNTPSDVELSPLRQELQTLLRENMGVVRCEAGMQSGLSGVSTLLERLGEHDGCYEKNRLYNDLLTAQIALRSALCRKGSVGCHTREDSTEEAPSRVVIENKAGQMTALRERI